MKKVGLLLILLIVGIAGTAVSLFVYGGLVSSTKTCIATSNEYYDTSSGGYHGADRYLVNVNCSGQTAVANSQVHWNSCYVKVNDTVTVQFYNWYTPGLVGDNSC